MKNAAWELVLSHFNSQRILYEKKSEQVIVLIWTNFDKIMTDHDKIASKNSFSRIGYA